MLCISFSQAELSKPSVAAAPLERRNGNTQHLLVSTSALQLLLQSESLSENIPDKLTMKGKGICFLSSVDLLF